MKFEMSFNVSGNCDQTIELNADCSLSVQEVINGLNGVGQHTICTTANAPGEILLFRDDGGIEKIGRVVSSIMDGEYDDFEIIKY